MAKRDIIHVEPHAEARSDLTRSASLVLAALRVSKTATLREFLDAAQDPTHVAAAVIFTPEQADICAMWAPVMDWLTSGKADVTRSVAHCLVCGRFAVMSLSPVEEKCPFTLECPGRKGDRDLGRAGSAIRERLD